MLDSPAIDIDIAIEHGLNEEEFDKIHKIQDFHKIRLFSTNCQNILKYITILVYRLQFIMTFYQFLLLL